MAQSAPAIPFWHGSSGIPGGRAEAEGAKAARVHKATAVMTTWRKAMGWEMAPRIWAFALALGGTLDARSPNLHLVLRRP